MSHTKRIYNNPDNSNFVHYHPFNQYSMRCCCRRCMKPYITRKRRSDYKVELRREVNKFNEMKGYSYRRFSVMPSVQYLQDGFRCCLENKGCPEELCYVRNPKTEEIEDYTLGDWFNEDLESDAISNIAKEASLNAVQELFNLGLSVITVQGEFIVKEYPDKRVEVLRKIEKKPVILKKRKYYL